MAATKSSGPAAELAQIRDVMDKTTGEGRDYDKACELADAYVAKYPEQFAEIRTLTLDECVQAVTVFRNAGLLDEQWRVETWILHHYEPLQVGGPFQAQVRINTKG